MYEREDMLRMQIWELLLERRGLRHDLMCLRDELIDMEDLFFETREQLDIKRDELEMARGRIEELEEQASKPSVGVSDNPRNLVGREATSPDPHTVPGASPRLGQWPPEDYAVQFRQMMEESNDL